MAGKIFVELGMYIGERRIVALPVRLDRARVLVVFERQLSNAGRVPRQQQGAQWRVDVGVTRHVAR